MTKLTVFFYFTFFQIVLTSCGQSLKQPGNSAYLIDGSAKHKVDEKSKSFFNKTISTIDIKMFENDSVIFDTYSIGKSIDDCMLMSTLDGDTINIDGYMGMFAGLGYQIALFKDTCIVSHFAKSDAEIYKLHKNDSLSFGVSVPLKTYKLTLTAKPTFKKGEVVEGVIELTSCDYYEVANGKEAKCKIRLTGYFKTAPLESIEDKYNKIRSKWHAASGMPRKLNT